MRFLKNTKTDLTDEQLELDHAELLESEPESIMQHAKSTDLTANSEFIDDGNEQIRSNRNHSQSDNTNNCSATVKVSEDCNQKTIPVPIANTALPVLLFHDIGYLQFNDENSAMISQQLRTEMVSTGSRVFQNADSRFPRVAGRSMTAEWFKRRLANGNVVNRSWLVYSPHKEAAYCFCCLLFPSSSSNSRSSFELPAGYSNWKKNEKVKGHENSHSHRKSFTIWKETERIISEGKGIDAELQSQIQSEKQRWREVLMRVLACIKFLACQNLALRGHRESLTSSSENTNVGNFLALLKLIAQYDPILESHLKNAMENPGSVSYLSPQIQNEFIGLLASAVRNQLLENIRRSKYYGILFDSTPDLAHREQLSQVIRYVDIDFDAKTVSVKESFLGYIKLTAKDAATLEEVIMERLEADNLPLADCRSQCYDNASVKGGHISGLQQRLCARNPRAVFVNCDNHCLNLAGVGSAKQDPLIVTFFGTVESIYSFFSRSTIRWEQLKSSVPITVKRESDTRWSARAEAVEAITKGLNELVALLEKLSEDKHQTENTISGADTLLKNILNFNFIAFLYFWNPILDQPFI
ncbi:hypothetical protein RI129_004646 [Pyrocoelia pectoralis]|uniref:TTF-type domain-containing protein n=1 Tax=Pyrocoelia pectoralis TaxID=417401 RepID=A0AAN7VEC6_9COLE